tara:strand:- start:609 stop:971 length:363 start_codon:yes stop_codon:yes gene_type:complete
MIFFKQVFTWWHNQTIGTLLKTLFTGKFVGKDEHGNKYYTNKKNQRWIIYKNSIEATKITSNWFLWMHGTIDEPPVSEKPKEDYLWQKKHLENMTGTNNSYKPNKISKIDKHKKYDTWKS